ncbi:hypothetical protein F0562_032706 [Nyssa sinensis]|uniref:Uncharacterized protein n=1 Tax=Nyssa sinensis TaxID=561372 RepID=A0A5J5ANT2_9ASTE|nr:hypothetical protein F0562_032706 [Nyssa sinensis]
MSSNSRARDSVFRICTYLAPLNFLNISSYPSRILMFIWKVPHPRFRICYVVMWTRLCESINLKEYLFWVSGGGGGSPADLHIVVLSCNQICILARCNVQYIQTFSLKFISRCTGLRGSWLHILCVLVIMNADRD